MPPALFALVIFQIGSHGFCPASNYDPPIYASYIAGITGTPPHSAYLLRWGLINFCPSWSLTLIFLISTSQVAGIIDVSLGTWFGLPPSDTESR
jgi:hypothetical protein